jgi:hypothetical protein
MHRIKTDFLKKVDKQTGALEELCVLELVESAHGSFHLLKNILNYTTKKFKKLELFKSYNDLEEVEIYYNAVYVDTLNNDHKRADDGDTFNDLQELLILTDSYVDRENKPVKTLEEQPRLLRL